MIVPSYAFLAFAAVAALAINVSAAPAWRRAALLAVNLAFIASFTHDPLQLAPFAGLLAAGYGCIKLLEVYRSRIAVVAIIVGLLGLYFWLKRSACVPPALFLPFSYFTLGLSYVFFRVLQLVIDAYQGALPEAIGPVSYINFTLNFTALVAGPIQFYRDYIRTERDHPAALDRAGVVYAAERTVTGFCKVTVVAPILAGLNAWSLSGYQAAATTEQRVLLATLVLTVFPVYLYANFSGYTDLVVGVARFLRLELPENFAKPFMSAGFLEFWGRWHMSLSTWLKTYVYSALLMALMRRYSSRSAQAYLGVASYFVTFFLVGLWHGQTSEFFFFGFLNGAGVSLNKLYQLTLTQRLGRAGYRSLCNGKLYSSLSRGVTFVYFAFALLWFWSTWPDIGRVAGTLGFGGIVAAFVAATVVASSILAALKVLGDAISTRMPEPQTMAYVRIAWPTALAVLTVWANAVFHLPAPYVVYGRF